MNKHLNRWVIILIGVGIFAVGIFLFGIVDIVDEDGNRNYLAAVPTVVCFLVGGLAVLFGMKYKGTSDFNVIIKGEKKSAILNRVNSMNVLVRRDSNGKVVPWMIYFCKLKKPMGQLRKCENDGKRYYVHLLDIGCKKLKETRLPDTVYLDPRQMKIPYTMEHDKEFWKPVPTLWQKVGPFALVLTLVIEWIIKITTGGS